jgi:hypothetical protein
LIQSCPGLKIKKYTPEACSPGNKNGRPGLNKDLIQKVQAWEQGNPALKRLGPEISRESLSEEGFDTEAVQAREQRNPINPEAPKPGNEHGEPF